MRKQKQKKTEDGDYLPITYYYSDLFNLEDVKNRHLYLNFDVDESIIDAIVYHIFRYNAIDKGIPAEERIPIMLYINCYGGDVSDGYGLIDAIRLSETPVYTVNLAMAGSMGFMIFIAGHKRYAMPHSRFLLHEGYMGGGIDSATKVLERIEFEMGEIEEETKRYILNRTKISEKLYEQKKRCEWYFLPDKGKEIGAVDYIIGQDCAIGDIL